MDYRAIGDPLLHEHLASGPKNAQYTSSDTQNEIIKLCRSLILCKVGAEVKENGLSSIICDECTDGANQEQLSLPVRYVANNKVGESSVGFFELSERVTGEAIANDIEKVLHTCNLGPSLLRGQAYDGASNMSGWYKSCAAILLLSCIEFSYS